MVDEDENHIDDFIQSQKAKLYSDRQSLGNTESVKDEGSSRKKWEKDGPPAQPVDQRSQSPAAPGFPLSPNEQQRLNLQQERRREYKEYLQTKNVQKSKKENIPPGGSQRPPSPEERGLLGQMGTYEQKRKKLDEDRKREYNQLLVDKTSRSTGQQSSADVYGELSIPIRNHEHDSAQEYTGQEISKTKARMRNAEYNEFLRDKNEKEKHRFDSRKPPPGHRTDGHYEDIGAALPLADRHSAQRRKEQARNQEYNDMVRQKEGRRTMRPRADEYMSEGEEDYRRSRDQGPRRGWGTPTYEEILERKRKEEMSFRRHDDPELYSRPPPGMRLGDDNYMRSSVSDGFLHNDRRLKDTIDERRLRDLDREYESRKNEVQHGRQLKNGLLNGLDPDPINEFNHWDRSRQGRSRGVRFDDEPREQQVPPGDRRRSEPPPRSQVAASHNQRSDPGYQATLFVGNEDRGSAKMRKQEEYRRDLERQMAETKAAKQREKTDRMTSVPEKKSDHFQEAYTMQETRKARQQPSQDDYLKYGDNSPRSEAFRRHQDQIFDPPSKPMQGILEGGLGLYDRPPPHQPVLSRLHGEGGTFSSPLDEAYYYYGMRNPLENAVPPLDIYGGQGQGQGQGRGQGQMSVQQRNEQPQYTSQDTPKDRTPRRRDQESHINLMANPPSENEQRSKSRTDKVAYQVELQRQMEEKTRMKAEERRKQQEYDRRKDAEIANYDPFGKGGAGAPMKDTQGNIIADLKRMRKDNQTKETEPRKPLPQQPTVNQYTAYNEQSSYAPQPSYAPQHVAPPGVQEQPSYGEAARGGGMFGEPVDNGPKNAVDKYKLELQQQIDEKKRKEAEEKAMIKQEEEREQARIEEERLNMQREFEKEQQKQREKEEAARQKNEEIRLAAEQKKREAEDKRKEAEGIRLDELRERQERERLERQHPQDRESSPPIPTMRSKTEMPQTAELSRGSSPPVPAKRTELRSQSADVLNQLASMRRQLQSERKRVENALENQKYDVDVFDPRTVPRAQPSKPDVDVFELARNKHPVKPPTADTANAKTLREFNDLKYRTNTESRAQFRSIFPEVPSTNDALETQQLAMLRQQEDMLHGYSRSPYEKAFPDMSPKSLGLIREESTGSVLPANSAFIDVGHSGQELPDDLEDLQRHRNDSARQRRRNRLDSPPRRQPDNYSLATTTGSVLSLDPDRITRKNEERLRKLRTMAVDDGISVADPDDILDRFMSKQTHNRPPSGTTLNDDSWLRPGTTGVP